MDHTKEPKRTISFCTGYGGIERGVELAGVRLAPIVNVEIEAYALANMVSQMEANTIPTCPIFTDVKTFPSEGFRDRIDLLTGGYPCQPFSAAGLKRGSDDPRHLWPFLRRHINAIRPERCFFENVAGHVNRGLEQVIENLESDGYKTTWGLFSPIEVGGFQTRSRVFVLAHDTDRRCTTWGNGMDGQADESDGMADSDSTRLEGRALPQDTTRNGSESNDQFAMRCGTPYYGGWATEPRMARVAERVAHRIDRTRMVGNGVCPPQAAHAWKVLESRLQKVPTCYAREGDNEG